MLGEWAEIKVSLVDEMKHLLCYRHGLIKASELLLNKLVDEKKCRIDLIKRLCLHHSVVPNRIMVNLRRIQT